MQDKDLAAGIPYEDEVLGVGGARAGIAVAARLLAEFELELARSRGKLLKAGTVRSRIC